MKSILVVDDDPYIRYLVRACLAPEYTVYEAGDGPRALELLASQQVDAVVCDVMMPGMSGLTVAHALRKMGDHIPLLFLSACDRPDDIIKGINAGARHYLTKPFKVAALKSWVKKILG